LATNAQPITASQAQWSVFNAGITGIATNNVAPYSFQFNSQVGEPVVVITREGDVKWFGKPSQAAVVFQQSLQFHIENQVGITKAARRRYYYMACRNMLGKAESMTHEEFVDFLRKHVYTREGQVIMGELKGEK